MLAKLPRVSSCSGWIELKCCKIFEIKEHSCLRQEQDTADSSAVVSPFPASSGLTSHNKSCSQVWNGRTRNIYKYAEHEYQHYRSHCYQTQQYKETQSGWLVLRFMSWGNNSEIINWNMCLYPEPTIGTFHLMITYIQLIMNIDIDRKFISALHCPWGTAKTISP